MALPGDDALGPSRQQLEARGVVGTAGYHHVDPLVLVQLELVAEDLLVEGVLQALVGEVDQELLELVAVLEVLEACGPVNGCI